MKKLLALLLAGLMMLSFAACGTNEDNPSGNENNPGVSQTDNKGGESTNGGGEENNGGGEENNGDETKPAEDTFETRMAEVGLPGLAMPDGCTYEKDSLAVYKGAKLTKESGWTSDDLKAFVRSVWTHCGELTDAGIFDGTFGSGKFTVKNTYESIIDKYAEFDTAELTGCDISWHYTYEGSVYQLKITRANNSNDVKIYAYNTGCVIE